MAILRNGKNTQQYKAQAEARAKVMAEAMTKAKAWAEARAEAKAKAEAEAKAKAEAEAKANAARLEKLNSTTYKMWCYWEHDTGSTPTFSDVARLIGEYAAYGFPVPKILIEAMSDFIQDLSTTSYPEPEEELVPLVRQHCHSSEPCACELDDKWADEKWFIRHYASGECRAYKSWI